MSNTKKHLPRLGENISADLLSGSVVFLVSIPLCLGIALASNAPLISGLIAGIIGGIVVGALSGSNVSVSGPAAGLTVICVDGIAKIGYFEGFLTAVLISGFIQVIFGIFRFGILGEYCPSAVIKGMLAGIGGVIILKQIPHALGKDTSIAVDTSFWILEGQENSITQIFKAFQTFHPTATTISVVSIILMLAWDSKWIKSKAVIRHIPASLLAIIAGVSIDLYSKTLGKKYSLDSVDHEHYVNLPDLTSWSAIQGEVLLPDLTLLFSPTVWIVAATIAVVGSLESLLSVQASDKLDRFHRRTSMNRELFAQGVGNAISGAIGGIPITSVMIRSSANIYAGCRTKLSTLFNASLLCIFVFFFPKVLELIPLSALAAILIIIGFKLMSPKKMFETYKLGRDQFMPYFCTFIAILLTDLLTGIMIGLIIGLYFVLKTNHHDSVALVHEGDNYLFRINKDISFVNKAEVQKKLLLIPDDSQVLVDGTRAMFIDRDVYDMLIDFSEQSKYRNIDIELKNIEHKSLQKNNAY